VNTTIEKANGNKRTVVCMPYNLVYDGKTVEVYDENSELVERIDNVIEIDVDIPNFSGLIFKCNLFSVKQYEVKDFDNDGTKKIIIKW